MTTYINPSTIEKIDFNIKTIEQELLEKSGKEHVVLITCDEPEQTKLWIDSHINFVRAFMFEEHLFAIKL